MSFPCNTNSIPKNLEPPKWLYFSSIGEHGVDFHFEIAKYVREHPETRLAFQPGSFQIILGAEKLKENLPCENAFFYYRDPGYLEDENFPKDFKDLSGIYSDSPGSEEASKLKELKEEIIPEVLRRMKGEKIPTEDLPIRTYSTKWDKSDSTPELAVPYVCSSIRKDHQDFWRGGAGTCRLCGVVLKSILWRTVSLSKKRLLLNRHRFASPTVIMLIVAPVHGPKAPSPGKSFMIHKLPTPSTTIAPKAETACSGVTEIPCPNEMVHKSTSCHS